MRGITRVKDLRSLGSLQEIKLSLHLHPHSAAVSGVEEGHPDAVLLCT